MSINSHPHKLRSKNSNQIDKLVYFAVIAGPLVTIPQLYDIWVKGQKHVSVISWSAYLALAFIWLWYGLKHRELPIIITQFVWIIIDAMIVIGIVR